ncbi:ATP-binding protein [Streptomyces sp. NPDC059426]|uniref:ATP-binding protein n=1 Tax=Streptomyces sp. NPDC059426 TaxID=3346827 RepID=UPI0036C7425D
MELLVSEVVTNALIHAHSKVDLRLREYPHRIRVEVRDGNPYPPVPTALLDDDARNLEAESGRGLLIVEALATAWGSSPAGRGETTWFEPAGDLRSVSATGARSSARSRAACRRPRCPPRLPAGASTPPRTPACDYAPASPSTHP